MLALIASVIGSVRASAQIVVVNPLEWAALVEGNEVIDGQIKNEIDVQAELWKTAREMAWV